MPVVTEPEFRRLLRGLDSDEFARFVAALWAARGYETAVEGATVRASDGADSTVIAVRHDARLRARLRHRSVPDADVVVTSGDAAPGTDALGAGELYDLALYGIDRDDCRDVFEAAFGRPPTRPETGGTVGRARAAAGIALAVLVVLAVAAAAGPLGPAGEQSSADPLASGAGAGPAAALDPATPTPAESVREYASATTRTTTVPEDGHRAIDLAYAHADALSNASFRVASTQRWVRPNGTVVVDSRLTGAFAANRSRYAVRLVQEGQDRPSLDGELWAGGGQVLRALTAGNQTTYERVYDGPGRPTRPRDALFFDPVYVEALPALLAAIDGAEVELNERDPPVDDQRWAPPTVRTILGRSPTDDPLVFELRATLSAPAVSDIEGWDVGNATLTAILDSSGRFYRYSLSYDMAVDERRLRVEKTVRFSDVGSTTVARPPWYDAALNATRRAGDDAGTTTGRDTDPTTTAA